MLVAVRGVLCYLLFAVLVFCCVLCFVGVCCSLRDVRSALFAVRCSLFVVFCWLSLFVCVVRGVLFVVCCLFGVGY